MLGFAMMAPAVAHAVLPSAVSYEYFGFNFANNEETSHSVGTLDYTGHPGCGSSCVATTALGANPSTSVDADEVVYQATSGGFGEAELGYYFEYVNTPGSYIFTLNTSDFLAIAGLNRGQNLIKFGPAGTNYAYLNNFAAVNYENVDCVGQCIDLEGNFASPAPFSAVSLSITANTLYYIQIDSIIGPVNGDGTRLIASIDPTLTTTATGGQILFSPGVTAGVPEPRVWMMLIVGLGVMGGALRRQRGAASVA
jgi:hypothetical protein